MQSAVLVTTCQLASCRICTEVSHACFVGVPAGGVLRGSLVDCQTRISDVRFRSHGAEIVAWLASYSIYQGMLKLQTGPAFCGSIMILKTDGLTADVLVPAQAAASSSEDGPATSKPSERPKVQRPKKTNPKYYGGEWAG